ncbi:MAG: PPK2 family polyphosphate kinase [Burkholderiales bacterium]
MQKKIRPDSTERFAVTPPFRLDSIDPSDTSFRGIDKAVAQASLAELSQRLDQWQNVLYADQRYKILLILQGMDTSGKDGTIRQVFKSVDPLGVRVAAFKAPTAEEKARDFLCRVHAQVPKAGEIVIFNRSHYEDVLVPVVLGQIDALEQERRFAQIRDFERLLHQSGTVLIKCFLHLSKEEQKRRLQERLDRPEKQWKFDPADLQAREQWNGYQQAYEALLNATSTEYAPWWVVPADSKTNRNLMISRLLIEQLERLELRFPEPQFDPSKIILD